eukprot:maker-scaffold332_size203095-snap-gene-1.20 protein:Tk10838 transcript:maker-scaffold332_size203095-snap-gene-1.20-mRNA-1 annotation:"h3k9 methyltransferase"
MAGMATKKVIFFHFCQAASAKSRTNRGLYRVQWAGWPLVSDQTWEPMAHLESLPEKLKAFYLARMAEREKASPQEKRRLEVPPDPRTSFEKRSTIVDSILSPPPLSELNEFFMRHRTEVPAVNAWSERRLNQALDKWAKSAQADQTTERRAEIGHQLMLRHLKDKRQDQLERLQEWNEEINRIDGKPLKVENDYDLEGPPRHMSYITEYMPAEGITIPEEPPLGCECGPTCSLQSEQSCCPNFHGHLFPYTKQGKLRLDVGAPIYECNKACQCGPDCANRIVQKGRKTKLSIFRTSNGCGWGVKTLEPIKRGTYVVEYVGEVITSEAAEERGKKYDAEGRTYLFDLDFNMGQDNPYTVDAALFGNVAHFINHSCDPNLSIFNVWIDCLDPNLPRLGLFARRDIAKNEQITFDYCQQSTQNYVFDDLPVSASPKPDAPAPRGSLTPKGKGKGNEANKTQCRCGAPKCRNLSH